MTELPCIFITKINSGLLCPLCKNVYVEPVLATSCGHSFCKLCTEEKNKCPRDNKEIEQTIINISLSEQISQLEIHCKNGCILAASKDGYIVDEDGCPEIIKYGERSNHEDNCEFAFVECPRNPQCKGIRKKNLEKHLDSCQKLACIHEKFGCKFKGIPYEIELHMKECHFEGLKDYIQSTESRIHKLQFELESSKHEIKSLNNTIIDLMNKYEQLELSNSSMDDMQKSVVNVKEETNMLRDHVNELNEFVNVLARQYEAMIFQQNFRCLGTFVGHQGPVWTMTAYGELLFTGSSDNTIKVWDLSAEFMCIKPLEGHTDPVLCLTVSDKRLFSGGKDNSIGEWCLINLTNIQFVKNAHPQHYIGALASNEAFLASGSHGSVKVWNVKAIQNGAIHEISNFNNWVRCISTKDNVMYVGGTDILIFNMQSLMLLQNSSKSVKQSSENGGANASNMCELVAKLECPKAESHVHSMVFMDRNLVCGTSHGDIYIWDIISRTLIHTLPGHLDRINSLACLYRGGVWKIFSASNDRTIRVWRLDHMTCTQILARHQGSVQSILFWKGRLFSAAIDTSIKVWIAGS